MKRRGLKLTPRLVLVAALPLILMFAFAVAGISSSCGSIIESMVQHELMTAQYAFETSVANIAELQSIKSFPTFKYAWSSVY